MINLDTMTLEEIVTFIKENGHYDNDLIDYAYNKEAAMRLRMAGNIDDALKHESVCDLIYDLLPDHIKW